MLPVSQMKPIPWSTMGLSSVTTIRRLATFSKSFYGLPIGSFPTFKGTFISLAKTPLKCLVSCLLTFQQCNVKVPVMLVSLEISIMILFPNLDPPCLLRWSLVPLPSCCKNSLNPVSQMETSHFHIPPLIPTVPFLQFLRGYWSSHAPFALSFPPSLPRSKPLTIVVSQL